MFAYRRQGPGRRQEAGGDGRVFGVARGLEVPASIASAFLERLQRTHRRCRGSCNRLAERGVFLWRYLHNDFAYTLTSPGIPALGLDGVGAPRQAPAARPRASSQGRVRRFTRETCVIAGPMRSRAQARFSGLFRKLKTSSVPSRAEVRGSRGPLRGPRSRKRTTWTDPLTNP